MTQAGLSHAFFAMRWDVRNFHSNNFAMEILDRIHSDDGRSSSTRRYEESGFAFFDLSYSASRRKILPIVPQRTKGSGVVFGRLFRNLETSRQQRAVDRLSEDEQRAILDSGGAKIAEIFWGRYIAFIQKDGKCIIISDPTAGIPCFYTWQQGVVLAFSNLEICDFLNKKNFNINYDFVRKLLIYDKLQTGETGLDHVYELLAGQRAVLADGNASTDFIWDASRFAKDTFRGRNDEAARHIKETAEEVVASWASCYESVHLRLSGGLDSSIVLACLSKMPAPPDRRAIHQLLLSADVSELRHARRVAEHFDCPLSVHEYVATSALPEVDQHPPSARPFREFLAPKQRLLPDLSFTPPAAVFTGQGGDHLFWIRRSIHHFCDHLMLHGLTLRSMNALIETARLTRRSVWSVAAEALGVMRRGASADDFLQSMRQRRTSITDPIFETIDLATLRPHSVKSSIHLPPGKAEHINSLLHLIHVRRALATEDPIDVVHPLFSQPLMEICLRIPTPVLGLNGESRGLARAAFENELPQEIVRRKSKGSASRFFSEKLVSHQNTIRDALADGALSACGIIRREDVLCFVDSGSYRNHPYGHTLLNQYVVEAWLRTWQSTLKAQPTTGQTYCIE